MENNSDTTKSSDFWMSANDCFPDSPSLSHGGKMWVEFILRSQTRNVRCIEKNRVGIFGVRDKRSRPGQDMSGPAAVARLTACPVLSRIVIYCHKIITLTFALVFVPRLASPRHLSISAPSRIHLSRLRDAVNHTGRSSSSVIRIAPVSPVCHPNINIIKHHPGHLNMMRDYHQFPFYTRRLSIGAPN